VSQKPQYTWLIYFIIPAFYNPVNLCGHPYGWHRAMHHHIICNTFNGIYGFTMMQYHIMCLLSPTSCYLVWSSSDCMEAVPKGILQNSDQSTGLWKLHWGMQAVRAKWVKVLSYWNDTCPMIPVWLNSGITEHLLTFQDKKHQSHFRKEIWANDKTSSYTCQYHTFHNVSRQAAAVNCTFIWKENVLIREHMPVTSSYISIAGYVYKHWLKWLHHQVPLVVKHGWMYYSDLCWSLPHRLVQRLFNGIRNSSTHYCSEYWLTAPRRIFTFPCEKAYFPQYKRTILWEDGLLNHCCDHVITWFINGSMLSLYAPTCLLLNAHQWDNCKNLPQSMSHNTQLITRKCDFGCWFMADTCSWLHRVVKHIK
jgi:hypothetical protein